MKKKLLTIILIISILVFSATTIYAADGGQLLASSGFEKQEKSNWCWVACARNSVHHETSNHRTQRAAVMHIKGTILDWYPDEGGTISEIEEAAEYISKDTESYTGVSATRSFSFLKNEVELSNATITCAGYYNNNVRNGGHAVVIIGYYISGSNNYIVYHDPWDNTSNTCLYSEFCDGSYNGRRYDYTCYNSENS